MKKSQDWRALGVDGASPGTPQKLNIKPFYAPENGPKMAETPIWKG